VVCRETLAETHPLIQLLLQVVAVVAVGLMLVIMTDVRVGLAVVRLFREMAAAELRAKDMLAERQVPPLHFQTVALEVAVLPL
jgi:hypothetical protein